MLSGRAAREYSGAHFKFQRKLERQRKWLKGQQNNFTNLSWRPHFYLTKIAFLIFWFLLWFHFLNFWSFNQPLMSWICSIVSLLKFFLIIFSVDNLILFFHSSVFGFLIFISKRLVYFKASMQRASKRKSWNSYLQALRMPHVKSVKSISYHHHPSPHFIHPPSPRLSLPPLFLSPPSEVDMTMQKGHAIIFSKP